jgi:hypothetical protein
MDTINLMAELRRVTSKFVRGTVVSAHEGHIIVVSEDENGKELYECEVLETSSEGKLILTPGNVVLICIDGGQSAAPVVLGRISGSQSTKIDALPDELSLEVERPSPEGEGFRARLKSTQGRPA